MLCYCKLYVTLQLFFCHISNTIAANSQQAIYNSTVIIPMLMGCEHKPAPSEQTTKQNDLLLVKRLCSPQRCDAVVVCRRWALRIHQDVMRRTCEPTFGRRAQEEVLITRALCPPAVRPVSLHLCLSVCLSLHPRFLSPLSPCLLPLYLLMCLLAQC